MFRASIPRVIATEIRWEEESSYTSIAMMYAALMEGVALQWDAGYVGAARNTRQKTSFKEYHERSGRHHGFSQTVHSLDDASRAMDAIVEQGEGANSTRVSVDFSSRRASAATARR